MENRKNSHTASLALRIWHPSFTGAQISKALKLAPSIQNDIGAVRKTPTGQMLTGVYPKTYWVHKFNISKEDGAEESIARALKLLELQEGFLKEVHISGGKCEFYLGVFLNGNSGIELSPALIEGMATLHLHLGIELYVPEGEPK